MHSHHLEIGGFIKSFSGESLNKSLQYVDLKGNMAAHALRRQMQNKINHSSFHCVQPVTILPPAKTLN